MLKWNAKPLTKPAPLRPPSRGGSPRRPHQHPAFSLVELVIVIVIIAILAAIAVPRFSQSVGSSRETALSGSLSALRNAIHHYSAEHDGVFPGATADGAGGSANSSNAFISQLTQYSAADGRVSATQSNEHLLVLQR